MNSWRILLCTYLIAVGSSEVVVKTVPYSCCISLALNFDQNCENTWSTNGKNIAYFKAERMSCIDPCKKIESGQMILDACVDINLTTVCHHTSDVVKENCFYYQSQACSWFVADGAPKQSSVGLALLTAGWIVKQMILWVSASAAVNMLLIGQLMGIFTKGTSVLFFAVSCTCLVSCLAMQCLADSVYMKRIFLPISYSNLSLYST